MLNQTRAHPGIARESKFQGPGISGLGVQTIFGANEANLPHKRAEYLHLGIELNGADGRSSALK